MVRDQGDGVQRATSRRRTRLPDREGEEGNSAEKSQRGDEHRGSRPDRKSACAIGRETARGTPPNAARRLEQAAGTDNTCETSDRQGKGSGQRGRAWRDDRADRARS